MVRERASVGRAGGWWGVAGADSMRNVSGKQPGESLIENVVTEGALFPEQSKGEELHRSVNWGPQYAWPSSGYSRG
jgi:hypothetical protein